jgi:hypothetical protein
MSVTSTLAKDASLPTELDFMGEHRPCQEFKTRVKVTDSDKHSNGQEDQGQTDKTGRQTFGQT